MDRIIIKDLEVYGFHGVHAEEKKLGQLFLISIEIVANLEQAAVKDRLQFTVDYGKVCDKVKSVMSGNSYDLIETAALEVIKNLFADFPPIISVKVEIKKPWAPLGHHLKYVAVELERARHNMRDGSSG